MSYHIISSLSFFIESKLIHNSKHITIENKNNVTMWNMKKLR